MTEIPTSTEVLRGVAAKLEELGLARWTPGVPPAGSTVPSIHFEKLPDKPEAAIAIAAYNNDRSRDDDSPDYYIQLRGRAPGADPFKTHDYMDSITAALHDSSHSLWGTTSVLLCRRHICGALTPNANGTAWSRADSYTITVNPS